MGGVTINILCALPVHLFCCHFDGGVRAILIVLWGGGGWAWCDPLVVVLHTRTLFLRGERCTFYHLHFAALRLVALRCRAFGAVFCLSLNIPATTCVPFSDCVRTFRRAWCIFIYIHHFSRTDVFHLTNYLSRTHRDDVCMIPLVFAIMHTAIHLFCCWCIFISHMPFYIANDCLFVPARLFMSHKFSPFSTISTRFCAHAFYCAWLISHLLHSSLSVTFCVLMALFSLLHFTNSPYTTLGWAGRDRGTGTGGGGDGWRDSETGGAGQFERGGPRTVWAEPDRPAQGLEDLWTVWAGRVEGSVTVVAVPSCLTAPIPAFLHCLPITPYHYPIAPCTICQTSSFYMWPFLISVSMSLSLSLSPSLSLLLLFSLYSIQHYSSLPPHNLSLSLYYTTYH